jgi:hypothetical protein
VELLKVRSSSAIHHMSKISSNIWNIRTIAALLLARGADFLSNFGKAERDVL